MKNIHYSNGDVIPSVIVIWDDWSFGRAKYYRAYWSASPENHCGSTVFGYASNVKGSHRTIKQVIEEVNRFYPGETIYRNGKVIYQPKKAAQ